MVTQRTYFIGNSVTDTIKYDGFADLAANQGHTQIWGRHMIPGAPLSWIWQHPNDGFQESPYGHYPNALPNYQWDSLSLQPFDRHISGADGDLQMIGNFVNLAKSQSQTATHNLQVYLYQRWPRQTLAPTLTADSWNTLWSRAYQDQVDWTTMETRDFFSDLLEAVNGAGYMNGMKSALIVPVGDVMYALNNRMKFDQIPGYDNIWQLYEDYAHLNGIGSYIVATTFYARLYNQSPVGLSVPPQYGSIDPGLVSTIQQTVWEVVKNFNPRNINPIGINDAVVTSQGMALVISASALLSNDLDGDSDTLKIARTLVSAPANGRLGRTADGNFRYIPNAGFTGTDQFRYTVQDGKGGNSTATVNIMVKGIIQGTNAADVLIGTADQDNINGLGGADQLTGLGSNDLLNGGNGNDQLNGGDGDDLLRGSGGKDQITSGAGQDRITLINNPVGAFDVLSDFTVGSDRLLVSKSQFGLTQAIGELDPNSFYLGSSATDANHRFIYDVSQGKLFFDADGNGVTAPRQIAQLSNLASLGSTSISVTA